MTKELFEDLIIILKLNNLQQLKENILRMNIPLDELKYIVNNLLIYSIENNSSNLIIEYLINISTNKEYESSLGKTPLFVAIEKENFYIANILLEYSDINYINQFTENVLIYLFRNKTINQYSLNYILSKEIDINYRDKAGKTSLIYAVEYNNFHLIQIIIDNYIFNNKFILNQILLSKKKVKINNKNYQKIIENGKYSKLDLNIKDKNGNSALILASKMEEKKIVKLLIDNGANVNDKDKNNYTPINWAIRSGHEGMVKLLIECGANIHEKDNFSHTVLTWATLNNYKDIVKLLIDHGAHVNEKSSFGFTPLMWASANNFKGIVELLIENGANINDKNKKGNTALMMAVQNNLEDMVKLLIKNGANIDEKDKDGNTALCWASQYGKENMVRVLIKNGANVNEKNKKGGTPLILAANFRNEKIVKILLENGATINEKNEE